MVNITSTPEHGGIVSRDNVPNQLTWYYGDHVTIASCSPSGIFSGWTLSRRSLGQSCAISYALEVSVWSAVGAPEGGSRDCDAASEAMHEVTTIIIALVCIFGGAHTDGFAGYRARLIGPFETEYDVEKWEKALRQGLGTKSRENFRTDGPDIPCCKAWSNGRHRRTLKHLRGPTAPK